MVYKDYQNIRCKILLQWWHKFMSYITTSNSYNTLHIALKHLFLLFSWRQKISRKKNKWMLPLWLCNMSFSALGGHCENEKCMSTTSPSWMIPCTGMLVIMPVFNNYSFNSLQKCHLATRPTPQPRLTCSTCWILLSQIWIPLMQRLWKCKSLCMHFLSCKFSLCVIFHHLMCYWYKFM